MSRTLEIALVALLSISPALPAAAEESTPCAEPADQFVSEFVVSGLVQPTATAFLPGGRLLVAERGGRIVIADPGAALPASALPYMTVPGVDSTYPGNGLLDLVLDPAFETNGFFYVYYSNASSVRFRISRFRHLADTGDATEVVIWQDDEDFSGCCHWGGSIDFGPADGKLYLSTGDKTDDPVLGGVRARDLTKAGGKILRMNADGSVPPGNPFDDGDGPNEDLVWAFGLRNPFRARFDDATGRLFVGDVGSSFFEEINVVGIPGSNFGWSDCEGPCDDPAAVSPLFSYDGSDGASLTSGIVYRGSAFPSRFVGRFFYADYVRGWLRQLTFDPTGRVVTGDFDFADGVASVVDIKEGADGAIYLVHYDGSVSRIRYDGAADPAVCDDANPCTSDTCGGSGFCEFHAAIDGVSCDADANVCTGVDTCLSGACMPDAPFVCDDFDSCTSDSCDAVGGCIYVGDQTCSGLSCVRGDCNANGILDAGDPVCSMMCLLGTPSPGDDCICAADCNCSSGVDAGDPVCGALRAIDSPAGLHCVRAPALTPSAE